MQKTRKDKKNKFNIFFQFENEDVRASVTKIVIGNHTNYTIYPLSPQIIRRFGVYLNLFKEDDNFSTNLSGDEDYKEYINRITTILQDQD